MGYGLSDSVIAGCVSGVLCRVLTSPLDVIKIRLQLQIEPTKDPTSKYRGMYHASKTIFKEEGVRAFWKGFLPGQVLYAIYGGAQFTTYEQMHKLLTTTRAIDISGKTGINFVSGCSAGLVATVLSFPFDVLRTRMISQGEPKVYPNMFRGILMMYSENGISTFYRGVTPAILVIAPRTGLHFAIFKYFCLLWTLPKNPQSSSKSLKSFICGGLAGILSKLVTLPFDMVKKRLEIQGFEIARAPFGTVHQYKGFSHCFLFILKNEGLFAFYKGATPALIKATMSVALSFYVYGEILSMLEDNRT